MSLNLDHLGPALVLGSVIAENTETQLHGRKPLTMGLPQILFLLGWGSVGYHNLRGNNLGLAASAGVAISVMQMMKAKGDGKKPAKVWPMIFAASWLGIGRLSGRNIAYQVAIPTLALGSMMQVMPWQRTNNIVDGPGMPMFTLAWVLFILNNKDQTL